MTSRQTADASIQHARFTKAAVRRDHSIAAGGGGVLFACQNGEIFGFVIYRKQWTRWLIRLHGRSPRMTRCRHPGDPDISAHPPSPENVRKKTSLQWWEFVTVCGFRVSGAGMLGSPQECSYCRLITFYCFLLSPKQLGSTHTQKVEAFYIFLVILPSLVYAGLSHEQPLFPTYFIIGISYKSS